MNSNNGPSPGHSNLGSDGRYTCSGLLLMDSWFVPYLLTSCRPDFNHEVTRIVAPYWPPHRLFEFDSNNNSSPSHSNLVSDREYISSCLIHLWFPGGCHICPRATGLTSIMVQEVTQIVAKSSIEHGGTRPFFYMVDQYFGNDSLEPFECIFVAPLALFTLWRYPQRGPQT